MENWHRIKAKVVISSTQIDAGAKEHQGLVQIRLDDLLWTEGKEKNVLV